MTNVENVPEKKKRFRSPPYPMFDLGKAVDRASQLLKHAHHHPVGATMLSESWGMKSVDGKVWRTAAALIQYGLIIDSGKGKSRKFQIADTARRIIQDTDPASQKRKDALKTAALSPMIHKELWEKFQTTVGLSDSVLATYLTLDRVESGDFPYSDSAAAEVIEIYRASLAYAGIGDSDALTLDDEVTSDGSDGAYSLSDKLPAKVGNYIQWTSGGVEQFKPARRVNWVSEDGVYIRVHGSTTGIKMSEATVVDPPAPPPAGLAGKKGITPSEYENDINVLLTGKRLQITADVDEAGIERLKQMLTKYEEILKLLSQPVHGAFATEYSDDEEGREAEQRDRERDEEDGG